MLLTLVLVILMSGILINNRFASAMTVLTAVSLFSLTYLQQHGLIEHQSNWRAYTPTLADISINVVTFALVMVVSWISNQEIEKSLRRARLSEKELKKERDLLEIKVEERTQELRRTQMERFLQVYHFADFGRLAAGLLHDLANPLTLVSLNLSQLQEKHKNLKSASADLKDIRTLLNRAIIGTERMETFIQAARKQVQKQDVDTLFDPATEIRQVIQMFSSKAEKSHVKIRLEVKKDRKLYGNPVKFYQIFTNLLSNAIDAYEGLAVTSHHSRQVLITQAVKSGTLSFTVQDWGIGIPTENLKKLFEPFFTTKAIDKGTGIGLAISQEIVEKEFNGKVTVKSSRLQGTVFTVIIPLDLHTHTR